MWRRMLLLLSDGSCIVLLSFLFGEMGRRKCTFRLTLSGERYIIAANFWKFSITLWLLKIDEFFLCFTDDVRVEISTGIVRGLEGLDEADTRRD